MLRLDSLSEIPALPRVPLMAICRERCIADSCKMRHKKSPHGRTMRASGSRKQAYFLSVSDEKFNCRPPLSFLLPSFEKFNCGELP